MLQAAVLDALPFDLFRSGEMVLPRPKSTSEGVRLSRFLRSRPWVVAVDEELFRRYDHEEGGTEDEIIGFGQAKDRSLRAKYVSGQAQRHRRWTGRVSRVIRGSKT
jgi:hypothetical protein